MKIKTLDDFKAMNAVAETRERNHYGSINYTVEEKEAWELALKEFHSYLAENDFGTFVVADKIAMAINQWILAKGPGILNYMYGIDRVSDLIHIITKVMKNEDEEQI